MNKIKVIAIIGKSAAGKDSVRDWIVKYVPNTTRIITCTTRPPREGEIHGINYNFYNEHDFDYMILQDQVLECAVFRGWVYWTAISALKEDKVNVGVYNLEGLTTLLNDDRLDVCPIFVTASDKTRLIRSLNREENPDVNEICRRYFTDEKDFKNITVEDRGYIYGTPYFRLDNDSGSISQKLNKLFQDYAFTCYLYDHTWKESVVMSNGVNPEE